MNSSQSPHYEHILYRVEDGIAILTLNRPERLNAYIPAMGDEIVRAFRSARDDRNVRVIVLTGAGRAFCAGVDLEALKQANPIDESAGRPKLGEEDFIRKLPIEMKQSPKPLIAAINGHAIGVGVTMTLPCDIRLAAAEAKIGLTFTRLGILPGLGSTHLLPRLVGMGRAQELILSGRIVLGAEAKEIGLVQICTPAEQLMPAAMELARGMAEADPAVLTLARRALYEGPELDFEAAMRNEQALSAALRQKRSD